MAMSRATLGASPASAIAVEHVGVGPVEEETHDRAGTGRRRVDHVELRLTVLAAQEGVGTG